MQNKLIKIFFSCLLNTIFFANSSDVIKKLTLNEYLQEKNKIVISQFSKKIEIKDQIKRVIILCPANVITGGPENLCQIYKSLKNLGYEVYIAWLSNNNFAKEYRDGTWYLCRSELNLATNLYKEKYEVNYLSVDVPLDESTLVIVPEIWIDFLYFFENAKKAIAWLSIGFLNIVGQSWIVNSLIENKKLNYLDCIHLSQAPWIQKVLLSWGAESYLLGDYISQEYLTDNTMKKIDNLIAFFPKKGGGLAMQFIEKYPDLNYIKLENFNFEEMKVALESAKIYIDFGSFPGKDRVPREALAKECVIFIHNQGCATDFESFPIDDYFRFSTEDICNGVLYNKVKEVLADYKTMQQKQAYMRHQIFQEYDLFEERVKEIFGIPLV